MQTELIVSNANVLTMSERQPHAEAFAIRNGRMTAVGREADVRHAAGSHARVLDLGGRTVTPGLIDTHVHVVSLGSIGAGAGLGFVETGSVLDVSRATSADEIVQAIAVRVAASKPGDWVISGWPAAVKGSATFITHKDLDRVSPHNPVMVTGYPYTVVNSYLLRQAGITKDTVCPDGGEIIRFPDGHPTGALAFQSIYQLLPSPPQPTIEETERAITKVQRQFLSEGITAYKDVGLRDNAIAAYRNLHRRGELICRTQMMYTWLWTAEQTRQAVERLERGGDEWLALHSMKLSLDGDIKTRTAWSHDDWLLRGIEPVPGSRGYWKITPENLVEMVDILHSSGWQIGCHCEGDRAIDAFLDAVERAQARTPRRGALHSVIHCTNPTEAANLRMQKLGDNICIETQSCWLRDARFAASLGPERSKRFIPLKSWLDLGLIVGNSCDFPPEPYPPRLGLAAAMGRAADDTAFGPHPFGQGECLGLREALHTYTLGAARCLGWDGHTGSIEAGKAADFVVWEEDLTRLDYKGVKQATVAMTAVDGVLRFQREGSRLQPA